MKPETTPCPSCRNLNVLEIVFRLQAKPLGTFSLSGAQMKFAAEDVPVLHCTECDWEQYGEYSVDGRHAVFRVTR